MVETSMLKYQYDTILDQLILLQLHAENPDCPCSLTGSKQGELGEYCEVKHTRAIVAVGRETIPMESDRGKIEYLTNLVEEGTELVSRMEDILCGKGEELPNYLFWAREKRKPLEHMIYTGFCEVAGGQPEQALREAIELLEEERWCFGVRKVDKELARIARTLDNTKSKISGLKKSLEMPINICRGQAEMFDGPIAVLDPYGSRCRDPETGQWTISDVCGYEPAGITTSALGMDGLTQYEFEFIVLSLSRLVVSHDPFTFTPNPDYPQELQPRLRERAATKVQVEKIAANLEPDALLTDFHTLDRGAPIIGPDGVVEAGNGRVMGIMRAVTEFPEKYAEYKARLRDRIPDFGLRPVDVDDIEDPVLVRVRISDVDRSAFTQEANSAATIAPSAIENARTDAQKITTGMLQELVVAEDQGIEDALRAVRNKGFADRFLKTLPENVQASLVDAQGYLNRDGVHRMAMAVFVSAFQGDTGLRLAEKAFESIDMDVRNTINAIARSLAPLAQAEALIRSGDRDTKLSIGDDLAQVVSVYSGIKRTPELTVEKYLAQAQLLARELTDFQEEMLVVIDGYRRSPKRLGSILGGYARGVIASPPPAQATLIPGAVISKEQLWEDAVRSAEGELPMFDPDEIVCDIPSPRYDYLSIFFESGSQASLSGTATEQKSRKIDEALSKLEDGIASIYESDNYREYLQALGKFHNYSLGNVILVQMQMPDASRVAGFNTWKELERNVRKGEHGIMILAPCFPAKPKKEPEPEDEDEEKTIERRRPIAFKVVHVFDVSQTEGKDLPGIEVPVIEGEESGPFYQLGVEYATRYDIKVIDQPREPVRPQTMGYYDQLNKEIWVRPDVPQDQRSKTLYHEIAHAMAVALYGPAAEVLAESVAYAVCSHFGFDTGVRSFPYVALWAKDVKVLKENLDHIRQVTKGIIDGVEQIAGMATAGQRVRFDRASIDSAIAAAKRLQSEKDLYVFATHLGYTIESGPPPGMQKYVAVHPDGSTETVTPRMGERGIELAETVIKCGQTECYLNSEYLGIEQSGDCKAPEIELRRTGVLESGLFLLHCKTASRLRTESGIEDPGDEELAEVVKAMASAEEIGD